MAKLSASCAVFYLPLYLRLYTSVSVLVFFLTEERGKANVWEQIKTQLFTACALVRVPSHLKKKQESVFRQVCGFLFFHFYDIHSCDVTQSWWACCI